MIHVAMSKLDEQTLTAYLTNRLSPSERADVTAALLNDPDARELLKMAVLALGSVDRPPIPAAVARNADQRVARRSTASDGAERSGNQSQ